MYRYTAFSELLPLLAAGATPLLKVDKICQSIDSSSLTIVNSTTLSSPFASFSFSASAAFEVRSPSRIQVTDSLRFHCKEMTNHHPFLAQVFNAYTDEQLLLWNIYIFNNSLENQN